MFHVYNSRSVWVFILLEPVKFIENSIFIDLDCKASTRSSFQVQTWWISMRSNLNDFWWYFFPLFILIPFFLLYFISFWFDKKVIWCICQLMNLIDKFPPSFFLKQNSYCKFSNIYKKNPPRQNNQLFSKSVNKIQSFNLLI